MTDNEIKKALACCIVRGNCQGCPLWNERTTECLKIAITNALDLINRLEAKVEFYKKNRDKYQDDVMYLSKQCDELQAENERLLQELQCPQADTVQLMSKESSENLNDNIVYCKECQYLMFSDMYGECSKGYKGIVSPNDSCLWGKRMVKCDQICTYNTIFGCERGDNPCILSNSIKRGDNNDKE